MRSLLLSLALATSSLAFLPTASADPLCLDAACVDPDTCALRSDCCDGALGGGFWCPEESSAGPTCTGYVNVAGSKQRWCVDPSQAPQCGAWTEGWSSPLGYFRTCYGTAALCNPQWCLDAVDVGTTEVDLRWLTNCPGPWGHEERTQVGPVIVVTYECDDGGA